MRQFAKSVVKFVKAEDGPTAVEYAVMLALILVACITIVTSLGTTVSSTYGSVNNNSSSTRVTGSSGAFASTTSCS